MPSGESEWKTRKQRIDPKLDASGWRLPRGGARPLRQPFRSEEEETDNGPADYALWLDNAIVGVVEAKKLTVGPQNVLTQAERYARGLRRPKFRFDEFGCPFLYATNGEIIWFHDVRHPLNWSRQVARFHTPNALKEMLSRDFEGACEALLRLPHDHPRLRPYQKDANAAVEGAIADRKRNLLVAMATGTGKTFMVVNQVYRLMKTGVARRVLFLVDRRALAAQAVRAFSAFEAEPGKKFDQIYEVYSSRFQTEDFGEEDKFDPKVLPQKYLTDPQPGHAFVYICTIQRMAINILGRQAIFGLGDEAIDEDAAPLDIPIHAFDVVVADECHRGYTSQEISTWRSTLDHFDAIKIGLTATPASHTTAYFTQKVFEYSYEQAVKDGHLVDYDVVRVRSDARMSGLFLREGENVEVVDPRTGLSRMDQLEDEREFATAELEAKITAPDSNRKIIEELKKYTDDHEKQFRRFPKTLIFAVNDLPHTSHADQLAALSREIFNRGDAFVEKITGRVDRPLQKIREFRNRPNPGIAITVDLLSTGVDIPDLEYVVFLRPVRSRILFEQMLGRGTRKGERYPSKDHFTVVDCFDGTLLAYFKKSTGITKEDPAPPTRTIDEIVRDIWSNKDRDYNIGCLVKRLQRIDKAMSGEARDAFAAYVPEGDVAKYARELPTALRKDFVGSMTLLRNPDFQELLVNYPRPERTFLRAYEQTDNVSSILVFRDVAGGEYRPEDYLTSFSRFVRENEAHIEAIRVLLDRPREWSATALAELRQKLAGSRYNFTTEKLQRAHEVRYKKPLVDVISMVKHAAKEDEPLLTAAERVERAFARVTVGQTFTADQQKWLDRIRQVMLANLSIDREDFEYQDTLSAPGGWGAAKKHFGEKLLTDLIHRLNETIAA
ncbi:type I restriction endonuclease subunit R [Sorangium sp. So ce1000]|uniref:type I restriction endonuclease subunit R n=1 Tax=Sorangium sp. So ce1000 TaxID=3133325 RepID=UPI003F5F0FEE